MKPEPLKRYVWKRAANPNSRSELNRLTPDEDTRVRAALDVARIRFGNWKGLAAALKTNKRTITRLLRRERRITPAYALRLARVLGVALGDVLSGRFPREGACPMCEHPGRPSFAPQGERMTRSPAHSVIRANLRVAGAHHAMVG